MGGRRNCIDSVENDRTTNYRNGTEEDNDFSLHTMKAMISTKALAATQSKRVSGIATGKLDQTSTGMRARKLK